MADLKLSSPNRPGSLPTFFVLTRFLRRGLQDILIVVGRSLFEYTAVVNSFQLNEVSGRRRHAAPFLFPLRDERFRYIEKSVPKLCQRLADLAVLAEQGKRKLNNLRIFNKRRPIDSVPGHHCI